MADADRTAEFLRALSVDAPVSQLGTGEAPKPTPQPAREAPAALKPKFMPPERTLEEVQSVAKSPAGQAAIQRRAAELASSPLRDRISQTPPRPTPVSTSEQAEVSGFRGFLRKLGNLVTRQSEESAAPTQGITPSAVEPTSSPVTEYDVVDQILPQVITPTPTSIEQGADERPAFTAANAVVTAEPGTPEDRRKRAQASLTAGHNKLYGAAAAAAVPGETAEQKAARISKAEKQAAATASLIANLQKQARVGTENSS